MSYKLNKINSVDLSTNQVSNGWLISPLMDISNVRTGKKDANHATLNGKYRFYTCAYEYIMCDTKSFEGDCLILPGNGANVGEVFYYSGEFEAYQRTYVIEKIKINPKYLFYHLRYNWKRLNLDKQYGSATNYIRIGNFENYSVKVPPSNEQHQIVDKIEELFSELDNGIESLKKAREQLKTYRQAVLKYAFEGKLTKEWRTKDTTSSWKAMKLGDLINVKSGNGLPKAHQVDTGDYLVYGGNGIMGKHNKYMFEESKLIIGRVGVHCGNVHITKPKSWITDNAFVTTFDKDQVGIKYLLYFIRNLDLKKNSSSTAQPVISGGKIYPIDVKIPRKPEQYAIVQEIESRLSVCDKIEQTIEDSLKKTEALRQSILKKAFSGELTRDWREKNPELISGENSAEKLLERVKAEKEKTQSKKVNKR